MLGKAYKRGVRPGLANAIDNATIAHRFDRQYHHRHFECRTMFPSGTTLRYSWSGAGICSSKLHLKRALCHPGILDHEAASLSLGYMQANVCRWSGLSCGDATAALCTSSTWSWTLCDP